MITLSPQKYSARTMGYVKKHIVKSMKEKERLKTHTQVSKREERIICKKEFIIHPPYTHTCTS
jgi:hypothetical protein